MARVVELVFAGDPKGAIDATDKVGSALDKFGGKAKTVLVAGAAATAAATAATTLFAKKSVDAFKEVAGETRVLQRLTGGSAEEMSRWAYIADRTGVGAESLGNGIKKLSQNIVKNGDDFKELGIQIADAQGKTLPLDDVLGNIAEKFEKMPNGVDKNAEAIRLFGRGGTDLIPILNKGRDGLQELSDQADKYGLTLTQGNLDALSKNIAAHKDFDAAMEGVKVQLGAALMPALAASAEWMASTFVPVFVKASGWIKDEFGPAFASTMPSVKAVIASVVDYVRDVALPWLMTEWQKHQPAFERVWGAARHAFEVTANFIKSTVVPALGDMYEWLANKILPTAIDVAGAFQDKLGPAFGGLAAASVLGAVATLQQIADALGFVINLGVPPHILAIAAAIALVVGALVYAYQHFDGFRSVVDATGRAIVDGLGVAVDWLQAHVVPIVTEIAQYLVEQFSHVVAWFRTEWPAIQEAVTHVFNVIRDVVGIALSGLILQITVTLAVIRAAWHEWGDELTAVAKVVWEFLGGFIESAIRVIAASIKLVLDVINGDWAKAHADVMAISDAAWATLKAAARAFGEIFVIILQGIGESLVSAFRTATSLAQRAVDAGLELIKNGVIAWVSWWGSLPGRIVSALGDTSRILYEAGRRIVQGLLDGIDSVAGRVTDKIAGLPSAGVRKFKDAVGISSPSKVFMGFGENIGQGLVIGLERSAGAVGNATGSLADVALGAIGANPSGVGSAAPAATSGGVVKNYNFGDFKTEQTVNLDDLMRMIGTAEMLYGDPAYG